jgi:hypothetical protein
VAEPVRTTVLLEFPGRGTAGRIRGMGIEDLDVATRHRYLFDEIRPRVTAIGDYARQLFDRVAGNDVGAVVAYCGAIAVARGMAGYCQAEHGRRPVLVALNPELTLAASVAGTLRRALDKITDLGELADVRADSETVRADVARWLPDVEAKLAAAYAGPPLNLGPVAGQLAAMQADWLAHVTATCDPAKPPPGPDEVHLLARDHLCEPDCPARHEVVDAAQREFFTAPQTRRALAKLLAS